jgi:hypothetical protein
VPESTNHALTSLVSVDNATLDKDNLRYFGSIFEYSSAKCPECFIFLCLASSSFFFL